MDSRTLLELVFSCEICEKYKTTYPSSFVRHQRLRHNIGADSVTDCLFCKKKLWSVLQLEDHLRAHTLEKPYFCNVCGIGFASKSIRECHVRTHTGEKPYPCKVCGRPFRQFSDMKKHSRTHFKLRTKVKKEPKYKCKCGEEFMRKDKLVIHQRKFHTVKKVKKKKEIEKVPCPKCSKVFVKHSLERHLSSHEEAHLSCEMCEYKTSRKDVLERHKRLVHKIGEDSVNDCVFCKKKLSTPWELEQHLRPHIYERPFICKGCPREFSSLPTLKEHFGISHGNGKKKGPELQCPICSIGISQRSHFKTHLQTHLKDKPYRCEVCSRSFVRKTQLVSHTRFHTKEKPYACEVCGKRFPNMANLDCHVRIHTGARPYSCKICEKTFTQRTDMKRHLKRHAMPDHLPFKCKICGLQGFAKEHRLRKHERDHTKKRAYSCKVCEKKFLFEKKLQYHMRVHSGIKSYTCPVCQRTFLEKCHLQTHLNLSHKK